MTAAGRRGVLHLLALGDGQVIEYLVRSGARRPGEGRGQESGPGVGVGVVVWSRLGSRGEGAARECMGGSRGYNGVYTCEKLCARSSGMLFICVVIGLECRLGGGAG